MVVPFERASGLVFVEASRPSGPALLALLDTGANTSAIDPRVSSDLPVERGTEVVGTTGSVKAEIVAVPSLRLGGLALPALHATRRDLTGLLAPAGRHVDLILGTDALAGFALTLDFRRSRLELASVARSTARSVPMAIDNGVPTIGAELDGIPITVRIDTGASLFDSKDVYVNVPTSVWTALRARRPELAPVSQLQGTGADGGTVALPVVRVAPASIGALRFESVFVIVQPSAGYFASPEAKGFVGNNYLEKLGRVTLDFHAGRLDSDL